MAKNAQLLAFEAGERAAAAKVAVNIAGNEALRLRETRQMEGGKRRLSAAEAALCYDTALDAKRQTRTR